MLVATALVYLMGDRMFGRIPGVLAALLFAVCGIVVHLGAAATFDPMALVLLVLALYAAVRMRDGGVRWLLLCPLALAAANVTKYATIAWDPLIVGTIVLYGWSKGRITRDLPGASPCSSLRRSSMTSVFSWRRRQHGAGVVVQHHRPGCSSRGADFGARRARARDADDRPDRPHRYRGHLGQRRQADASTATAFLCLLVLAALLAPIEQARVHEINSLDENMAFGLPFAALGAGYALGAWRQWLGWQRHWGKIVATTAAVVTVITMLIVGRVERVQFRGPGVAAAAEVATAIKKYYKAGSLVLVDGTARTEQYNVPTVPRNSWVSSSSISAQARADICFGYVSVIVLKMSGDSFVNPADELNADELMHRMYQPEAVVGNGRQTTRSGRLSPRPRARTAMKAEFDGREVLMPVIVVALVVRHLAGRLTTRLFLLSVCPVQRRAR